MEQPSKGKRKRDQKFQELSSRAAGEGWVPSSSSSSSSKGGEYVVVVHVGAGYHAPEKEEKYLQALKRALVNASKVLRDGGSSAAAVEAAVVTLEDSPWTNAGRGSNLTLQGGIELDASLMDGAEGAFGGVGAVPRVKNPIRIAAELMRQNQLKTPLPLGRIRPLFLVAEGVRTWARDNGLEDTLLQEETPLITSTARSAWIEYTRRLQAHLSSPTTSASVGLEEAKEETASRLSDTVGAVCIDGRGVVAAGVSSGGIALKHSGRIGEAAMFGCGCWAQKEPGLGISVTGTGEHIIRCLMAKTAAVRLAADLDAGASTHPGKRRRLDEDTEAETEGSEAVVMELLQEQVEEGAQEGGKRYVGLVALVHKDGKEEGKGNEHDEEGEWVDVVYGHTTLSMGIGMASGKLSSEQQAVKEDGWKPETLEVEISRMDREEQDGRGVVVGGTCLRFLPPRTRAPR